MEDAASRRETLMATHSTLVAHIQDEEEELAKAHRQEIDRSMEYFKKDMELLKGYDKNMIYVDEYVHKMENIMQKKLEAINALRKKLDSFKGVLKQEEEIVHRYSSAGSTGSIPSK